MTDRPIIFSAPMVRALLDGTKTQTRRVLKLPTKTHSGGPIYERKDMGGWEPTTFGGDGSFSIGGGSDRIPAPERAGIWHRTCGVCLAAPYAIGDHLWVRENWNVFSGSQDGETAWPLKSIPTKAEFDAVNDEACRGTWQIFHKESDHARQWLSDQKWRPSIHMPRWASRLTLIVTDVRVQRLQDITLGDICAEGLATNIYDFKPVQRGFDAWINLWNSINGPDAWDANPWVVAVSFEVHQCNIDQMPSQQEVA